MTKKKLLKIIEEIILDTQEEIEKEEDSSLKREYYIRLLQSYRRRSS